MGARVAWRLLAGTACALAACGGGSGSDGSELPVPYDNLRGGIIFSTRAINGSAGYDLYWVPAPASQVLTVVPVTRLTDTAANETQPAVARNGRAMAFVSDDGIYVITAPEGRIHQVSDTTNTSFTDSLPSLSTQADRVAWVRADTGKPIGETGFFESVVMIANVDGTEQRAVNPKPGIVQDAPVFDPSDDPRRTRLAWTEFAPGSIQAGFGPTEYGVLVFDYGAGTGTFACKAENGVTPGTGSLPNRGRPYRCFGQHLAWPLEEVLVLGQDMLEISLTGQGLSTIWDSMLRSIETQQLGAPSIEPRGDGFFPAFPISLSYDAGVTRLVFDGVIQSVQADAPTLAIMLGQIDGSSVFAVQIDGYSADIDTITTANYLYSVATPRFVPY